MFTTIKDKKKLITIRKIEQNRHAFSPYFSESVTGITLMILVIEKRSILIFINTKLITAGSIVVRNGNSPFNIFEFWKPLDL